MWIEIPSQMALKYAGWGSPSARKVWIEIEKYKEITIGNLDVTFREEGVD